MRGLSSEKVQGPGRASRRREAPALRPLLVLVVLFATLPSASAIVTWPGPNLGTVPPYAGAGEAPPESGPDAPGVNLVAEVLAIDGASWACSQGPRSSVIDVPTGWNRVVAEYRQRPDGDPWDRLFVVQVNGVEVLRGTTPRTDFTLTKEWTRYASLLPQGGQATVTVDSSAWDCGYPVSQHAYLTLRFYDDPAVPDPAAASVANWGSAAVCGKAKETRGVQFPATAPARATLEFFASNHAEEEAQFYGRYFSVRVDGAEVANFTVLPYTYAILGIYGENDRAHPLMWWTAQRALDHAGVHTGPGEIPPYRVSLNATEAALLTGARDVQVYSSTGGCIWFTSASFLLYDE